MEQSYLTKKEIEAIELLKEQNSQKEVAISMKSSAANVSITLKRAREKIGKSEATIRTATDRDYLDILGIHELNDVGPTLDKILNSREKAVCIINKDHEIIMVNQALEKLFRKRVSDFKGKKCYEAFAGEKCEKSECPANISFKTGEPANAVRRFDKDNGNIIEVNITAVPIKNKRNRVGFVIEYMEQT